MPMPAPTTTFDAEYSDPAATATGWKETRKVLEEAELFWVSTVRADGRPHVTPVVAVWAEEALWFSTGANEQKFANMRANPHVVMIAGPNWGTVADKERSLHPDSQVPGSREMWYSGLASHSGRIASMLLS
jgi:pyridoxine/pyridoxamine 5'-phosphate oxidase